jgi:2,4-dienoyl-CoA reductase (NADPH2)
VAVVGAGGIGFDVAEYLTHAKGTVPGVDGSLAELSDETARFMALWGVDTSHSQRSGLLAAEQQEKTKKAATDTGAEVLSHNATGREVTLLQRKRGKLGAALGKTTGWIHRASLQKAGVRMVGGVKSYDKVDDEGLHVTLHPDKKSKKSSSNKEAAAAAESLTMVIPCDQVVVCAGQEPLAALAAPLREAGVPVFLIGGAEKASELDAKRAIDQGTRLAAVIEDAKSGDVYNAPVSWESKLVAKGLNFFGKNA